MEAKKFYTLEEIEDKYIGEKGTPKRDAYEDLSFERYWFARLPPRCICVCVLRYGCFRAIFC